MADLVLVQDSKCKCFSEQGGSFLQTTWHHSHHCLHFCWLQVSHTPAHIQVEDHRLSPGWLPRSYCRSKGVWARRYISAVFQSAICHNVYGVHIYYPIESIFIVTVCLAYLPLCIWELFRKKFFILIKKEMKLHILISKWWEQQMLNWKMQYFYYSIYSNIIYSIKNSICTYMKTLFLFIQASCVSQIADGLPVMLLGRCSHLGHNMWIKNVIFQTISSSSVITG